MGIANANITIDIKNRPVNFRNMHVRPYNCQTEETDNSYLETANILVEIPVDKPVNEEIPMSINYLEP